MTVRHEPMTFRSLEIPVQFPQNPPRRRRASFVLAGLSAGALGVLLLSCTSVGDGGTGATNGYLNRGATITPDSPGSRLTYVHLIESSGTTTSTCIGVEALRVSNVFSAAFTLTYDPTLLRYRSFDAGSSCLGTGSAVLAPQVDSTVTPGHLVVGLTRNAAGLPTPTGVSCGHLVDLCFDVIGTGDFHMDFTGNVTLLQPDGTPVLDLTGADYIGADVATSL